MNFKEEFDLSTLADVTEVNDSNSSIVKMFGYISLQVSESVSAIFSLFSVVLRHLRFHNPSSCVNVTVWLRGGGNLIFFVVGMCSWEV